MNAKTMFSTFSTMAERLRWTGCARPGRAGARSGVSAKLRGRMAAAWRRGAGFLAWRPFAPPPPLYLFLGCTHDGAASTLELGDGGDVDTSSFRDEFTWRRMPEAVWIDYPGSLVRNDGGRWTAFQAEAARGSFAGVVVSLDAARLAANDVSDAALLRTRLESLQEGRGRSLPVYLVIDNVDRLYGLRSLAARLDAARLGKPFGDVRDMAAEKSPAFFRRVLSEGAALLDSETAPDAAGLLAPAELARLEEPLTNFCRQVFLKGSDSGRGKSGRSGRIAAAPWIRGLFLSASAPGGGAAVPAGLARLGTFAPAHEPFPVQPWFLRSLFRDVIPSDAGVLSSARFAGRVRSRHVAAACIAAAVLSLFVTLSFFENRAVLLSARGRAEAPVDAEGLREYRELASGIRERADGGALPRLGLEAADRLADEMQKRYTESYFNLRTVPGIGHVQDAATAAVESGDPARIGNALLMLAATREGIGRNLNSGGANGFLQSLAVSLGLATPEDMRQLETYFEWAGRQDWMPATVQKLAEFEKYVLENAPGGDWLSGWVAALPGLRPVDTSRVWAVPLADDSLSRVGAAWTREGYAAAKGLMDAVAGGGQGGGDAFLVRYREQALEHWRVAAAVLWNKFRRRIADSDVPELLREAAAGDDPASRFITLMRHHLLPMFGDGSGSGSAGENPDAAWLRLRERLFGGGEGVGDARADVAAARWREALRRFGAAASSPEENFNMVRTHFRSSRNGVEVSSFDPLVQAGREAELLHGYLRGTSGSGAWDGLSPLSLYDYMRYLATRNAALYLDSLWRDEVYDPAHLAPGGDGDRMRRLAAEGGALERFLTGTAAGFWQWDGEGLANAEWRRLPFMLDDGFLAFCRNALRRARPAAPDQPDRLELPFHVRAVDVDEGAVERPAQVDFVLSSGGAEQIVEFNNFRIEETLVWNMDADALVEMRVRFPSVTAVAGTSFREFAAALATGEAHFGSELFGDAGEVLRRLGVSGVTVKARVENGEQVESLARESEGGIPRSIITRQ